MTSWWVMCLVTLLYMHHSAMMAVADDPRVAPDKSTWPGRKLKDIQPETPSNGGVRDLLAQDMCLYGGVQTLSNGSSTYVWRYVDGVGQYCGLLGGGDQGPSPQRVVTAYGLAVSQQNNAIIIADYDASFAGQVAFFVSGSIKWWSLNAPVSEGAVAVYPTPNVTKSWLEYFWGPEPGCNITDNATKTCLTGSITSAVQDLWANPSKRARLRDFYGRCPRQQCVTDSLDRTVRTIHTPRDVEQDKHAPWGPEGMYLDEATNTLYVADFSGVFDVPGAVRAYHWTTNGVSQHLFDFTLPDTIGMISNVNSSTLYPRGITMRPSEPKKLYVTFRQLCETCDNSNSLLGWVLKFDIDNKTLENDKPIFIEAQGPTLPMYRPDGLIWHSGPTPAEDILYVASYLDKTKLHPDTDRIMAFDVNGQYLSDLTIDERPSKHLPRAATQTLALYNNKMYMADIFSGDIRAYTLPVKHDPNPQYTVFVDSAAAPLNGGSVWSIAWGPCPQNLCKN